MVTVGNNEKPSKIMTYLYVTLCLTETMFILFIYGSICKRFITAVSVWMLTGIWINLKLLMEQSAHPLNSHLAMQETSNQQNIHSKFKLSLRQIISTLALISMSLHFQKFLFQVLKWHLQWFVNNYFLVPWTHGGTTINHHSHLKRVNDDQ